MSLEWVFYFCRWFASLLCCFVVLCAHGKCLHPHQGVIGYCLGAASESLYLPNVRGSGTAGVWWRKLLVTWVSVVGFPYFPRFPPPSTTKRSRLSFNVAETREEWNILFFLNEFFLCCKPPNSPIYHAPLLCGMQDSFQCLAGDPAPWAIGPPLPGVKASISLDGCKANRFSFADYKHGYCSGACLCPSW